MEKKIIINDISYSIKKNENGALDDVDLNEKVTDYFTGFDYIVGDWAYGKLRLKGFNKKNNKNFNKINDVALVDSYIKDYCAYGCKWFMLEKDIKTLENK